MQKKARKPYKGPELFKVKLIPQEAVLSGCKRGATTGKPEYGDRCDVGCITDVGS